MQLRLLHLPSFVDTLNGEDTQNGKVPAWRTRETYDEKDVAWHKRDACLTLVAYLIEDEGSTRSCTETPGSQEHQGRAESTRLRRGAKGAGMNGGTRAAENMEASAEDG